MVAQPILPVEVPVGWMIVYEDQHRYPLQMTPGIIGKQSTQEWLKQAVVRLLLAVENPPRLLPAVIASPPAFITWIRERLSLYDKQLRFLSMALAGGF